MEVSLSGADVASRHSTEEPMPPVSSMGTLASVIEDCEDDEGGLEFLDDDLDETDTRGVPGVGTLHSEILPTARLGTSTVQTVSSGKYIGTNVTQRPSMSSMTSMMWDHTHVAHIERAQRQRMRPLCIRCTSFACFFASNMLLPLILGVQMYGLNALFYEEGGTARQMIVVFAPVEVSLVLHMVRHARSTQAVRHGSLQWIVYSWLIAAKSWVLYYHAMQKTWFLWLTPVFYCVLTFRTLRQLFSVTDGRAPQELGRGGHGHAGGHHAERERDRQEHMTLDVVLLQDMVWHVVIDMIDIIYMMVFSTLQESLAQWDPLLLQEFPTAVGRVQVAVGTFVVLALFFHQQSFPTCSVGGGGARLAESEPNSPTIAKSAVASSGESDERASLERLTSPGGGQSRHSRHRHSQQDLYADVVKARKRSAIVSIILVDMPFFAIRTYMWSLSLSVQSTTAVDEDSPAARVVGELARNNNATISGSAWLKFDEASGRPQLDKWWVKNVLCMLLQAMQLRFVQQADLERSQSLRWWERGRAGNDQNVAGRRRRRSMQDPTLRSIWQEMDRNKLDAAMDAAGGFTGSGESDGSPTHGGADAGAGHDGNPSFVPDEEAEVSDDAVENAPDSKSKRGNWRFARLLLDICCCCFCCCRRRGGRCRWCSCDCSHSVFLHGLMGLALGWLIAKVDFAQAFTDLVLGLGWET